MKISTTPLLVPMLLMLILTCGCIGANAEQPSCKVCAEQRAACMKNYAGPTCKTEFQMCSKSCKK
jgi:hypothetical protein